MLKLFRNELISKGPSSVSERAIKEMEYDAERLVRLYLGKSKPIRPSRQASEFAQMAKGLLRANKAMERLGPEVLRKLFVMSNAAHQVDEIDTRQHMDYITRIAMYAERAAEVMDEESISAEEHKGGRPPDENLRNLVTLLMDRFQELLAIRPTHTVHKETGVGESLFDLFAKEAIASYAPDDVYIEDRKIDEAIRWALPSRDFEYFIPPKLPDC